MLKEQPVRKILSVVVPTYERCDLLDSFLENIHAAILDFNLINDIEVLISDNASSDKTADIARKYIELETAIFRYRVNEKNLGGPANLLMAITDVRSKFYMYIGDDDYIGGQRLKDIIKTIKDGNSLAYVFPWLFMRPDQHLNGPTPIDARNCLSEYFSNIGIPAGSAMSSDVAKHIIGQYGLSSFAKTNWPQTQLATIIVWWAGSAVVNPLPVGTPPMNSHDDVTLYTGLSLWRTWFGGLLHAAASASEICGVDFTEMIASDLFALNKTYEVERSIREHLLYLDNDTERQLFLEELNSHLKMIPIEGVALARRLIEDAKGPQFLRYLFWTLRTIASRSAQNGLRHALVWQKWDFQHFLATRENHMRKKRLIAFDKSIRDYSREGY